MKTLYKIIITIGIISLTSCTKHKDSTESTNIHQIDVPVENLSYAVKVSDFAENLFIPLETTENILTVVSTILGFIPFMLGQDKEAFWFPLAAGTIGGLIMSILGIFLYLPLFTITKNKDYKEKGMES